ncbi:MAG: hypothetical protein ACYSWS_03540 [Planctomycetota bacterium]|jgi:hypothetical protein
MNNHTKPRRTPKKKLLSFEILLREDGTAVKKRSADAIDDYFITLDFNDLNNFNT